MTHAIYVDNMSIRSYSPSPSDIVSRTLGKPLYKNLYRIKFLRRYRSQTILQARTVHVVHTRRKACFDRLLYQ